MYHVTTVGILWINYTLLQSLSHIHEMVVQIDTEANMCDNLSCLAYTTNSSYSLTTIYC